MAEHEYVRLAAACHCGKPARLNLGRGPKPKTCEDHAKAARQEPAAKECPACRGFFTPSSSKQNFCSQTCARRTRRGSKPRQMWAHKCKHCGDGFESRAEDAMYCGQRCKLAAWRVGNPEKNKVLRSKQSPKLLCAYFAGHCSTCGCAVGGKLRQVDCLSCRKSRSRSAAREASKTLAIAKHRVLGRVVLCVECAGEFCPLYGASHCTLCDVCAKARAREAQKVGKKRRDARIRGASTGEPVYRLRVFARDGWKCKLCGIVTPRELMGSMAHNAPELDHIDPVSKGGAHTNANTQCLCRSCNGWKSDRTMAEVMALLEG